jgi:hypothetical protein
MTVAWLIERKNYEGSSFAHWYAEDATGWHGWITDAERAKPFASRDEAGAFHAYRMIASDPNISITEHVFLNKAGA